MAHLESQKSAVEWQKVVGPLSCNCRCIACPETGEAALIDPGDEPEALQSWFAGLRTPSGKPLTLKWLLHTHGHFDHVGATRKIREVTPGAVIALHQADDPMYRALPMQGERYGFEFDEPLPVEKFLEHGEDLRVGTLKLSIAHTPGHSPGSICLRLHEDTARGSVETLYTGDTLFRDNVGRADLWGGDEDLMFKSIRQRILSLDDDTRVCPGHGPNSTIGRERRQNPFLI